jgi:hypothetical protein
MLPNAHAPTTGANFSRPCDLNSIRPNLLALIEKGKHRRQLTPLQCDFYQELCKAWAYYRPSQPPRYRGQIDGLIDAIAEYRVAESELA